MAIALVARSPIRWVRSRDFDLLLLFGPLLLALGSAALVLVWPSTYVLVLTLDMWLLSYHHVASTFTRLCFDRASFQQYRLLVLGLLPLCVAATAAVEATAGGWIVTSLYFYWQAFHYARQSYGIERIFRGVHAGPPTDARLTQAMLYLLVLWGVLHRSNQGATTLLGMDIRMIPVPGVYVQLVGVAFLLVAAAWGVHQLRALLTGASPVHPAYVLSHVAIFSLGYFGAERINDGWLILNVWHNAQYLLIVWMYNNRRFKSGKSAEHPLLSELSQKQNVLKYVVICLGLSSLAYTALYTGAALTTATVLFVVNMGINFHHYIVDGIIWKMRHASVRQGLGLSA
ncbi:hypothetical protein [Myxococcus sp. RHSTA-1-4]|uniref:hypothetical protein n=1 Tax=Myxococcus sp. RHSTA-1-4 TaxID=2874601 RepID=UPI001CBA6FE6|nr:hypothetical protein [Myxococcus sp. RHSTA-1-4]MBZ4422828.1 hypothetical protein [Myxococcus sp. RHSTA-1-4]